MAGAAETADSISATAKDAREQRKADAAGLLERAIFESGMSIRGAARAIGVSKRALQRWIDPRIEATSPPIEAALHPQLRRHVAGEMSRMDGRVAVEVPELSDDTRSEWERHTRMLRRLMEVVTAHAEAIADGHVTASEAKALRQEAWEAMRELAAVIALCARAEKERVIGVVMGPAKAGRREVDDG